MTESTQVSDAGSAAATVSAPEKPKAFGFSALISAVGRFFRCIAPLAIVILVNAIIQAILVSIDVLPGFSLIFLILMLISLAAFLWAFYYINVVALEGATGKPSISEVFNQHNANAGKFVLWSIIMYVVVMIGFIVFPWFAIAVLILFPFVPLAAADGQANPIKVNFLVIKERFFHWLIAVIVFVVLTAILYVLAAVNGFFIGGFPGSLIQWIVLGIYTSWVVLTFGLIYRSTRVGVKE